MGTEDTAITAEDPTLTLPDPVRQPRARGELALSVRHKSGRTRIETLRQQGSFKALFPHHSRDALQAVFLNTAGGITGGDRFVLRAAAAQGAHLSLTSQAAERVYRAQPGETGRVHTTLRAGAGARIDWLPQETILFEGGALDRRLDVTLAADATFLAVEPLVCGRFAMGERLHDAAICDRWQVRRDGRLVFADTLRLAGDIEALLARPTVADGNRAMAALLYVAPDAERVLAPLRAALGPQGAASLIREGVLFARALAPEAFDLRRSLIPAIRLLSGAELPRTWML